MFLRSGDRFCEGACGWYGFRKHHANLRRCTVRAKRPAFFHCLAALITGLFHRYRGRDREGTPEINAERGQEARRAGGARLALIGYRTLDLALLASSVHVYEGEGRLFVGVGWLNRNDTLVVFGTHLQFSNRARLLFALEFLAVLRILVVIVYIYVAAMLVRMTFEDFAVTLELVTIEVENSGWRIIRNVARNQQLHAEGFGQDAEISLVLVVVISGFWARARIEGTPIFLASASSPMCMSPTGLSNVDFLVVRIRALGKEGKGQRSREYKRKCQAAKHKNPPIEGALDVRIFAVSPDVDQ